MKLVLYFCILILGHTAFAASGGFDDEPAPAAKPASKPAAAPAAPVKVTPSAKTNFPKCPNATDNADLAQKMFDDVLDFKRSFPITIIENKPCKGTCAGVYLTRDKQSGALQIRVEASLTINSAARVCQKGSDLQVSADDYGKVLIISNSNAANSVNVHVVGNGQYDNSYTVK